MALAVNSGSPHWAASAADVSVVAEERVLQDFVALADHQFQPATAELVDGGVVLGHADGIQHGQHGDAALQADPVRHGRDGGQHRGG